MSQNTPTPLTRSIAEIQAPDSLVLNYPILDLKGQSTIEFLITIAFALGLVFIFISMSFNFSTGYLVHYANFMASRAYLVADSHGQQSTGTAETRAKNAFSRYKLNFLGIQGEDFSVNPSPQTGSPEQMYVGTKVTYKKFLSYIRFVGGATEATFRSESFLGQEPTRFDCWKRTCFAIKGAEDCNESDDVTIDDNGC